MPAELPDWARDAIRLYESNSASQFLVHGNIADEILIPGASARTLGSLSEFLMQVLLPRFQVVLSYDIGNGIRVEKGGEIFSKWPYFQQTHEMPKAPRPAVEYLTNYLRFVANLARLKSDAAVQVACIVRNANLLAPVSVGGSDYDLSALASLIRDWASETLLTSHSLATFLMVENLNDLHPLIVNNPRAARCKVTLPTELQLLAALRIMQPHFPCALRTLASDLSAAAGQLSRNHAQAQRT